MLVFRQLFDPTSSTYTYLLADGNDVALVRVEQLYPLPTERLQSVLAPYREGTPVFWVQEEPENLGAWYQFRVRFGEKLFGRWPFAGISRPASASPACGSANAHRREQAALIAQAFAKETS